MKINKITLGITALFFWRVHIDKKVCDLDVELRLIFNEDINNIKSVRLLKSYMIWV